MSGKDEISNDRLKNFFNFRPHNIMISTTNKKCEPNIAILNSSRIEDNDMIVFEIGKSITLKNITENPKITFMIAREGNTLMEYKGVRIYSKVIEIQTTGEKIEKAKETLRINVGKEAADSIVATVICKIEKIRPLVDRGQIWDKSI